MALPIHRIRGKDPRAATQLFLVEHRGVLSLIDTGTAGTGPRVLRALQDLGRRPEDVRQIVLTHGHGDHTGAAKSLREATGAPIVVSETDAGMCAGTAPYVGTHNLFRRLAVGNLAGFERFEPDRTVAGRQEIAGGLEMIPAPGHTPGHMVVWAPDFSALFAGDTVWHLGPTRLSWKMFTWDWELNRESVRALVDIPADVAFLGHGPPLRGRVPERLRDLAWSA